MTMPESAIARLRQVCFSVISKQMKEIEAIVYGLRINKVDWVHLVGKNTDIYKVYLVDNDKGSVKIDIKGKVEGNFTFSESREVPNGHLTKKLRSTQGLEYLEKCDFTSGTTPNRKVLEITHQLLSIQKFKSIKEKIGEKNHFYYWIKSQVNREDLIGDIAYDIVSDTRDIPFLEYSELLRRVGFKTSGYWEINSFRDHNKEGSVNPLLCLKLAKLEFDLINKKKKLSKFKIRNTQGFVYFLQQENKEGPIKIGRAKDIEKRIKQLQTSLPYDLYLIGKIDSVDYISLEIEVQNEVAERKVRREWYDITIKEAETLITKYNGK